MKGWVQGAESGRERTSCLHNVMAASCAEDARRRRGALAEMLPFSRCSMTAANAVTIIGAGIAQQTKLLSYTTPRQAFLFCFC